MKKYSLSLLIAYLLFNPLKAKADLFGGDLPLLREIVANTLHTMYELQTQTNIMKYEMAGILDRIDRVQAIAEVVQPSTWDKWKNPEEALRRLRYIYYTLPKEYRSEKSDQIEEELSKAMVLVSNISKTVNTSFQSGKEMERRGANSSPGVAQKLTASGVGTLITMEAQSQVIQSQIVSLMTQAMAEANEKEARSVEMHGKNFASMSQNIGAGESLFSKLAFSLKVTP
jgi:hypothetical protein